MHLLAMCCILLLVFFFKQKTAYEMRISDWSSDVCSSDLLPYERPPLSKEYFAGDKEFERIQLRPAKYWDEREVTMLLGKRVASVDPAAHSITTDEDETIGYGKFVWEIGRAHV